MQKSVKKILKRVVIVFLILFILCGVSVVMAFAGLEETTALKIGTVDLTQIPDGSYIGSYTNFR